MTLRFEQILTDGVAQCSYILGDDAAHVCAVVNPRLDVEVYIESARRYGMAITHVFETHIHADFMSGARELVDRLGGKAKLCVSVEGGAEYGFIHEPVRDGDEFTFGELRVKARFTPGHTPEHLPYFLYDGDKETPWGVLSGDAFFELKEANGVTPVDVRKPEEREAGHIPGATHAFLGKLREQIKDLDPNKAYATYCASGFRASIASSLLKANGIDDVRNVPGSWKAWTAAGYQTTTSDGE